MVARIKNISAGISLSAVLLGILAFTGSPAAGAILVPGTPVSTPGTVTLAGLDPVYSELVPFVSDNGGFGGTLISSVYSDPSTGGMDFTYQIEAATGYTDSIHSVSVDFYFGYSTNLDYVSGSGVVTYDSAVLSLAGPGDYITLDCSTAGIAPGDTSDTIVVKTNATQYDQEGDTAFIDGGGVTVNSLEPAGPVVVPEPMSLGLLAAGGVICAARRSRRPI